MSEEQINLTFTSSSDTSTAPSDLSNGEIRFILDNTKNVASIYLKLNETVYELKKPKYTNKTDLSDDFDSWVNTLLDTSGLDSKIVATEVTNNNGQKILKLSLKNNQDAAINFIKPLMNDGYKVLTTADIPTFKQTVEFDSLTEDQKDRLKGADGINGENGKQGPPIRISVVPEIEMLNPLSDGFIEDLTRSGNPSEDFDEHGMPKHYNDQGLPIDSQGNVLDLNGMRLKFHIPRGAKGAQGHTGKTGASYTITNAAVSILPVGSTPTASISTSVVTTANMYQGSLSLEIPAPTISVSASTLTPGNSASVNITTTVTAPNSYNISFGIPKGDTFTYNDFTEENKEDLVQQLIDSQDFQTHVTNDITNTIDKVVVIQSDEPNAQDQPLAKIWIKTNY